MPWIHVVSGPDAGQELEVADGATFGRDRACTVVLHDASVSRKHARLVLEAGRWIVVDTDSRNGLSVGGQRVGRAPLGEQGEFQLGDVRLRFVAARATLPAPAKPAPAEEEIVLEGEWTAPPAAPLRPAPAPVPRTASAPGAPSASGALERTAERPLPRSIRSLSGGAGIQVRAAEPGKGGADAARGVLRYSRFEERGGFSSFDLAQEPWYVKLGVGLLALALFGALAWGAYRTAAFFKDRAGAGPEDGTALEEGAEDPSGR